MIEFFPTTIYQQHLTILKAAIEHFLIVSNYLFFT